MTKACKLCKKKTGNGVTLHRIPSQRKDPDTRRTILEAINHENWFNSDAWIYLCREHLPSQFYGESRKRPSLKRKINRNVIRIQTTRSNNDSRSEVITELENDEFEQENFEFSYSGNQSEVEQNPQQEHTNSLEMSLRIKIEKLEMRVKKLVQANSKKNVQILRLKRQNEELKQYEKPDFKTLCQSNFTEPLASFVLDQVRNKNKPAAAHRFSSSTKKIAMSIQYHSPKTLRLLKNQFNFILPGTTTLNKISCQWDFSDGLNENAISALAAATKNLEGQDKVSVLLMDEMALDPNIVYDKKNDKLIGLNGRKDEKIKYTRHALVFMVKGVYKKFKQPICYYLETPNINDEMVKCITLLQSIGLDIVALVHDMGSNLLSTKKALGVTSQEPYFFVNGKKIFFFVDPPHLLKATRNNLHSHQLVDKETRDFCDWDLVKLAYMNDNGIDEKLLPCVKKQAIFLDKNQDKMKVSYAAKVLSGTMAYAIQRLIEEKKIFDKKNQSSYLLKFIRTLNKLFDIFNSSRNDYKKSRAPFKASPEQLQVLQDAENIFKNLEVRARDNISNSNDTKSDSNDNCVASKKLIPVQFIKGWRSNILALPLFFDYLKENYPDLTYLPTREINQDPLENFFGAVRSQNGCNSKPNAIQFNWAFKKLFVGLYFQTSLNTNSEADFSELLTSMNQVLAPIETVTPQLKIFAPDCAFWQNVKNWAADTKFNFFLSGFFLKKFLEVHKCKDCTTLFTASEVDHNVALKQKECLNDFLCPTEEFAKYMRLLFLCFNTYINDYICERNILQNISSVLKQVPLTFVPSCTEFYNSHDWLVKYYARTRLYFLCKDWKQEIKNKKKFLTVNTELEFNTEKTQLEFSAERDQTWHDDENITFPSINDVEYVDQQTMHKDNCETLLSYCDEESDVEMIEEYLDST